MSRTALGDAGRRCGAHMERNPGTCLNTSSDFDVLLWEIPAATIRSPDAALFDCAPNDRRPLPASLGYYRLYRTLNPEEELSVVAVPVRIQVEWARLAHLVRG